MAMVEQLRSYVLTWLESHPDADDELLRQQMQHWLFESKLPRMSLQARHLILEQTFDSIRGWDVLQPYLDDSEVTDIMVNHAGEIYIEDGGSLRLTDATFTAPERLYDLIQRMVAGANRSVNAAAPIVDARLNDGSRVHVVLPPIAVNGPVLTIRKFSKKPFELEQLIERQTLSAEVAAILRTAVIDRKNMIIGGGTGSGKTTLMVALALCVPPNERVVTVEDAAELRLDHELHCVSMETRNPNANGTGAVTIRDLIKAALRMRPDRLFVGEVRGAEAFDMLQAMNTGHDGSITTAHANSSKDMLHRLETMVLCGVELPMAAIRRQIVSALDLFVHMQRDREGQRRVTEVVELNGMAGEEVKWNWLYRWNP